MTKQINLAKLEEVQLYKHPQIKESWIQKQIAEDPSILGLGDLILKDKERIQPRAGRLDILLQEPETKKRYTVEIQLGKTDEAHLVRTLEYYDIERKRYPQYEHCGVIIAEDITTRFLNVISMFNGTIPLIALQMKAYKVGDDIGLVFTKILDEVNYGLVDEDEEVQELVDRDFWIKRSSTEIMKLSDELLTIMKNIIPDFDYKYNKAYIGMTVNGFTNNFVSVGPRRKHILLSVRIEKNEELRKSLEEAGLDVRDYNRWGRYDIVINRQDLKENKEIIENLLKTAWEENS
jgi:predicted transport protein